MLVASYDVDKLKDGTKSKEGVKKEQRLSKRIPVVWPLKIALASGEVNDALTENVSEAGLLISSIRAFKVGERAHVRVSAFSGGKPFIIDAIVIFRHVSLAINRYRCGAEFVFIKKDSKNFISCYPKGTEIKPI